MKSALWWCCSGWKWESELEISSFWIVKLILVKKKKNTPLKPGECYFARKSFFLSSIFTHFLWTLATEQTKKERKNLVYSGWKLKWGTVKDWSGSLLGIFHCVMGNLFCCRTKWYSRSTSWSRCLTQFCYVPYAITWKRVCEIQEIHVCLFNWFTSFETPH